MSKCCILHRGLCRVAANLRISEYFFVFNNILLYLHKKQNTMTNTEKQIYAQRSNKPCTDHIEDSDSHIYLVYVAALSLLMLIISNLL